MYRGMTVRREARQASSTVGFHVDSIESVVGAKKSPSTLRDDKRADRRLSRSVASRCPNREEVLFGVGEGLEMTQRETEGVSQ